MSKPPQVVPGKIPATAGPEPPVALRHPAALLATLVAAAAVVVSVTYRIFETDFWQHLLVGKAIWQMRRVPTTQLWSWPTFGAPDVNPSWGFRVLIWPLWAAAGA